MPKQRIMIVLLASIVSMSLPAGLSAAQPRLILNIVVDGLDGDYIELLKPQFTDGGFNRLLRHGVSINKAEFGTSLDPVAATAMLMTGSSPDVTGIDGAEIFDRDGLRVLHVMSDPSTLGNFTNSTYSPKALSVSTLADELRISSGGVTEVYSIAADPQQAVILAGHAGNAAIWLDDEKGNWASSTYYKDMPAVVTARNRATPLASRLDTATWQPSMPVEKYPLVPQHIRKFPFRYTFPRQNDARFDMFATSPLVNREITDIAGDLITTLNLGTHDGADMLNIAYTLVDYPYSRSNENRMETMDAYIRLDRDLEQLFAKVDRAVGRDGAIVMLAATPRQPRTRRDEERWGIPTGEFSARKAISLLNIYLMAIYGNGEWINAYHNGRFYVNRTTVAAMKADMAEVRTKAAEFLSKMTGVRRAYTIEDITSGHAGDNGEALRRNTAASTAGDIFVEIIPGWEMLDDFNRPVSDKDTERKHIVERNTPTTAPVFILAPDLQSATIDTPVDARAIAPTMARLLRIRSPNAAAVAPIQLRRW